MKRLTFFTIAILISHFAFSQVKPDGLNILFFDSSSRIIADSLLYIDVYDSLGAENFTTSWTLKEYFLRRDKMIGLLDKDYEPCGYYVLEGNTIKYYIQIPTKK